MKLFVNRKPVVNSSWGGGNAFITALFKFAPKYGVEVVTELKPGIDTIFLFDPRYDEIGVSINEIAAYKKLHPTTQVVHRVNECDARKGVLNDIDPILQYCSTVSDKTIFVSNWMELYHKSLGWFCEKNYILYNGVDYDLFHSGNKIDNGKINIVTHHWSDNRMKGLYAYEWLDNFIGTDEGKNFTFTYIGRHKCKFSNTTVLQPMYGKQLGDELGKYDVYVTGTKYDPAPNHVLEVINYMPVLVHANGGGAVELAPENVYSSHEELKNYLLNKSYVNNAFKPDDWETCIKKFIDIVRQ